MTSSSDTSRSRTPPTQGDWGAGEPIIPSVFLPDDPIRERYEDAGPIGRGGMGDVRRVYDRHLERMLAMKILGAGLVDDPHWRLRFSTEARITASLQHPGIVAVHDHGRLVDGRLWLTMREVRGRTLSRVIDELHEGIQDGAWPEDPNGTTLFRVVDAFRRLCDAVAYAHSRSVVHRDLKPANLMVGEFGEVQVMDWGLAKVLGDGDPVERPADDEVEREREPARRSAPPDDPALTQDGEIIGTPSYMSPEQARGDLARVGPPSDVWALGAVLRKILTGKPPIEGPSPAVLTRVILGQIKPIEDMVGPDHPPLPAELVAITVKALSPKMADRYPDAGGLARDLSAWLEGARRRQNALAVVEAARAQEPRIQAHRAQADALRARAEEALRALPARATAEDKYEGWDLEDRAAAEEREAALLEVEWLQSLRSALSIVPDLPEAHRRLADHYAASLLEAEARNDAEDAARSEALLRAHDRGWHAKLLAGDGAVTLVTEPPGAKVTAYRYVEEHRRLVPREHAVLGVTPIVEATLPHGSYLLIAEREGYAPLRYPVAIARGEHWDGVPPGGREPEPIPLLTEEALGDDLVYVPAGWFWSGGDPLAVESLPRRRVWVDAFLAGRHPVTNGEYAEFLRAQAHADGVEAWVPRRPVDQSTGDEASRLLWLRTEQGYRPPDDDDWAADRPVAWIDWFAANAFCEWRSVDTSRAHRLPNELEWEKLARGVDGRACAWGNLVEASWASLAGQPQSLERSPVSTFPFDESCYGARHTVGNVREWCGNPWTPDGPTVSGHRLMMHRGRTGSSDDLSSVRGGGWHTAPAFARAAGRFAWQRSSTHSVLGFRYAASVTRRA